MRYIGSAIYKSVLESFEAIITSLVVGGLGGLLFSVFLIMIIGYVSNGEALAGPPWILRWMGIGSALGFIYVLLSGEHKNW